VFAWAIEARKHHLHRRVSAPKVKAEEMSAAVAIATGRHHAPRRISARSISTLGGRLLPGVSRPAALFM
jgi:hypothetical protein